MKRSKSIFILLTALLLAVTIAACGTDPKAQYVGKWMAVTAESGGTKQNVEDNNVYFTLEQDGTGFVNLGDTSNNVTWEVTDAGVTVDLNGLTFDVSNLGMNLEKFEMTKGTNGELVLDTEKQSTYHTTSYNGMNFTFAMKIYFEKQGE